MLEIIATALAVIMIPAAPVNTAERAAYSTSDSGTQIVQPYTSIDLPLTEFKLKAFHDKEIIAYTAPEQYNSKYVEYMNYYFCNGYRNVNGDFVSLDNEGGLDASTTYNDHGFAWGGNGVGAPDCWILDVYQLIDNKSFVEVETPQQGDIILYYSGYTADGRYNYTHSGVVIEKYNTSSNGVCGNANTVKVVSKWLFGGTHISRGDLCPYVGNYTHEGIEPAIGVAYFRAHTQHSYSEYTGYSEDSHTIKCSCGDSATENHSYNYLPKGAAVHIKTCNCGYRCNGSHTWTPYVPNSSVLALLGLEEDYVDTLFIRPENYVKCIFCGYIKKLSDDEIVPIVPWD